MVLTERGVASRVRARRFGARHGKAVEDGHVLAVRGQVWSGLLWLGEAVEARREMAWYAGVWSGEVCQGKARQSMRGVALLGGAMHGTVRHGEVGCGRAVVEWRVLVRLVLASFGEARLGRARQSRQGETGQVWVRHGQVGLEWNV